ncbi:MAG: response regulator [Magnetococcus sp. DMHC-6]
MKFSTKLIFLCAGLVTLTGISIATFTYIVLAKTLEGEILQRIKMQSSIYLLEIDRMLFERVGDLRLLIKDPLFCESPVNSKKISQNLVKYRNLFKMYLSLSYYSNEAVRLADSGGLDIGLKEEKGSTLGQQWETVLKSNFNILVGHSTTLNEKVIYFTNPVRCLSDKSPNGVVVAHVALSHLHNLFSASKFRHDLSHTEVDLMDRDGLLLYSNHNHAGILNSYFSDYFMDDNSIYEDIAKNKIIFHAHEPGYLDFKGIGWWIQFVIARDMALAPAAELRNRILFISVVGIGLAIILAFFFARRFTQPIQGLVLAAQEIASGHLARRANAIRVGWEAKKDIQQRDELQLLVHSFEQMVVDLETVTVSRSYVDRMIESMTDLIVVVSTQGRIERVNHPEQLGHDVRSLLDRPIDLLFIETEDIPAFGMAQIETLIHEGSIRNFETTLFGLEGRRLPVLVSGAVMREEERMRGIILVVKEITDFKMAQEALRTKEAQLLAAQMANQAKSNFLATMSHEIRTPMNAIIGLTALALRCEMTAKMLDYLTKIESSSRSLLRIINDVLDFSKIEAGKIVLEYIHFEIEPLFDRLADMFRNTAAQKGIELVMGIAHDCHDTFYGDVYRLEQVLINLISNAIKFTDKGIIEVRVGMVSHTPEQITCQFFVRDTGIGLDVGSIERLFDPFEQADSSTTRQFGGTGLGLTICKRLIELMGGQIWLESVLGQGSVFRFTVLFKPSFQKKESSVLLPDALHGVKILVVDDNKSVLQVCHGMLKGLGLVPILMDSGLAALQAVRKATLEGTPFRLLLLDDRMRGMDGVEVAKQISDIFSIEFQHIQKPKILLMSAFGAEDRLDLAMRYPALDGFLSKPFNRLQLVQAISDLFAGGEGGSFSRREGELNYAHLIDHLGGGSVLLVEDTPINQQVVKELLEGVGMGVDIANNGVEAIQMVSVKGYDVVLMDIQMPVMDGYDATLRIRKEFDAVHLPIIAMTAHAMAEVRLRCMSVGMNDHIGKPIDIKLLFKVLMTHIKRQDRPKVDKESLLKKLLPVSPKLTSMVGIEMETALRRVMGNQELLWRLFADFKRDYADIVEKMRLAFQQGEVEKARKMAHQLKGVAGAIGATQVYEVARALDIAIKEGSTTDWSLFMTKLEGELRQVLASIEVSEPRVDLQTASTLSRPPDVTLLRPFMVKLAKHLEYYENDALHAFPLVKSALLAYGLEIEVDQLEKKINQYDFTAARVLLVRIAQQLHTSLEET